MPHFFSLNNNNNKKEINYTEVKTSTFPLSIDKWEADLKYGAREKAMK